MDNLSAAIYTSRFLAGALTAFVEFIQRRLPSLRGWRIEAESHGGIRRIQVAD
jgi:hypothetical protein